MNKQLYWIEKDCIHGNHNHLKSYMPIIIINFKTGTIGVSNFKLVKGHKVVVVIMGIYSLVSFLFFSFFIRKLVSSFICSFNHFLS